MQVSPVSTVVKCGDALLRTRSMRGVRRGLASAMRGECSDSCTCNLPWSPECQSIQEESDRVLEEKRERERARERTFEFFSKENEEEDMFLCSNISHPQKWCWS